jgi:hypothetical protein
MAWQKSLYFRYINACKGRRRNLRDLAWIMLKEDLAHRKNPKERRWKLLRGQGKNRSNLIRRSDNVWEQKRFYTD